MVVDGLGGPHAISIHALHEESDSAADRSSPCSYGFQSTLSMRRATGIPLALRQHVRISIHALHEESDRSPGMDQRRHRISIHALHEESDQGVRVRWGVPDISIHALHEESDTAHALRAAPALSFQSTLSMRRATSFLSRMRPRSSSFQSTLSMRRATHRRGLAGEREHISIHALHEESDKPFQYACYPRSNFNPRSP